METKKEFTAMDFLTFTVAGNVVVTDPITGKEFLCFRNEDNTFTHSLNNQKVTAEEIYAVLQQRIEEAKKVDAEIEKAKTAEETKAAAQQTPPPPPPSATQQAPQTPMFCSNCGTPLIPGTKFCTKCGKHIG